jgi:hypothetical protein
MGEKRRAQELEGRLRTRVWDEQVEWSTACKRRDVPEGPAALEAGEGPFCAQRRGPLREVGRESQNQESALQISLLLALKARFGSLR